MKLKIDNRIKYKQAQFTYSVVYKLILGNTIITNNITAWTNEITIYEK